MDNKLWQECKNGAWIFYTEDNQRVRNIKKSAHYKRGECRDMSEYYKSADSSRPFAWQFRVTPKAKESMWGLLR